MISGAPVGSRLFMYGSPELWLDRDDQAPAMSEEDRAFLEWQERLYRERARIRAGRSGPLNAGEGRVGGDRMPDPDWDTSRDDPPPQPKPEPEPQPK